MDRIRPKADGQPRSKSTSGARRAFSLFARSDLDVLRGHQPVSRSVGHVGAVYEAWAIYRRTGTQNRCHRGGDVYRCLFFP
jgi:hypothetical protein